MSGKLHSIWDNGGLLASRDYQLMEFRAGNFETHFSFDDDFTKLPTDDTTGYPTEYTLQAVEAGTGTSTATLANEVGGIVNFVTAGNEDDGVQLQSKGEVFKLASGKNLWYGCRVKFGASTQFDAAIGLCITTTTITDGVSDGVYFRTADADAALDFITEKNTTEESSEAITTIDTDAYYDLEFKFDGDGTVRAYVDGTRVATHETTIPDDEELAVSFAFTNGEAAAVTSKVDWVRCTQRR